MSTPASDHAEPQPAAPRSAEECIDGWVNLLGMFKADAESSGDLAEAMELIHITPQLLQEYPLMQIARKEAAASLLSDRIRGLDDEVCSMEKEPTSKVIPRLVERGYYDQLLRKLSLEDETLTDRVLTGDISPPSPRPATYLTHDEWMNQSLQDMNELDKNPALVSFLSKRGF